MTIALTNPISGAPCGTIRLLPGSDVELVCGSITARVAVGSQPVEIVLLGRHVPLRRVGEQATISISTDGSFVVTAVSGGDGKVTLVSNGISNAIDATTPTIRLYDFVGFSQPVDNAGVFNVVNAGSNVPLKWRLLSRGRRTDHEPSFCHGVRSPDQLPGGLRERRDRGGHCLGERPPKPRERLLPAQLEDGQEVDRMLVDAAEPRR